MSIAVIAGLGNPGPKYRNTRHNIGFEVVGQLARDLEAGAEWQTVSRFESELAECAVETPTGLRKLLLVKPLTYMNNSGRALSALLRYYKMSSDSLLVVYDDITLELGRPKLKVQGSAGGHNGIQDLLERVGAGFARYRIGIGAKPDPEMDLADYVLSQFKPTELAYLSSRMADYIEHLRLIIDKGIEPALNTINQRTASKHERNHHE